MSTQARGALLRRPDAVRVLALSTAASSHAGVLLGARGDGALPSRAPPVQILMDWARAYVDYYASSKGDETSSIGAATRLRFSMP